MTQSTYSNLPAGSIFSTFPLKTPLTSLKPIGSLEASENAANH